MVSRAAAAASLEGKQWRVPQPSAAGWYISSSRGLSLRPCASQRLDTLRPVRAASGPRVRYQHTPWAGLACIQLHPRDAPILPVMISCRPAPMLARMAYVASLLIWLMRGPVAEVRCWALRGRGVRSGSGWCSLLLEVVAFLCECLFLVPLVSLRRLVLVIAGAAVLPVILIVGAVASPTSTPSLRREGDGEATCCTEGRLLTGGPDPLLGALQLTALCITMSGTRVRAASPCGHPRRPLHGMRARLPALPIGSGRQTKRGGRSAIAARATAEEEMRNEARSKKNTGRGEETMSCPSRRSTGTCTSLARQ